MGDFRSKGAVLGAIFNVFASDFMIKNRKVLMKFADYITVRGIHVVKKD